MGGPSRPSAKRPSKSKHYRPDQNGDVRNVSPADDAEADTFKHQVDGTDEDTKATPSYDLVTPVAKRLQDHKQPANKQPEQPSVIEQPKTSFITRPDSNGSDVQSTGFIFAPNNLKNANISRPKGKRATPPTTVREQTMHQVQHDELDHQRSSQSQTVVLNRQPLGRRLSRHADDAPPPSYQPTALVSSVEQAENAENHDLSFHQGQGQEAEDNSESESVVEGDNVRRRSSIDIPPRHGKDPRQIRSASGQAADVRTDHATLGSTVDDDAHSSNEDQEHSVDEINNHAVDEEDMVVDHSAQLPETPAAPAAVQQEPPSTPTARKIRSASPLVVPMHGMPPRVTKPPLKHQRLPTRSTSSPVEDELSDQNLLEVLIDRSKRQKLQTDKDRIAADKYKTRIRTLNHSVRQLEHEKEEIEKSLQEADHAVKQASQDRESLQEQLEGSAGRYRKLKDFARSMAHDMKALKQHADKQKLALSELKDELSTGQEEARAAVSNAQSLLKRHIRDISSVRQETNVVFGTLRELKAEQKVKSSRLKDEVAKNRRLESHILGLQDVQKHYNKAAREGDQQIQIALTKIIQRFAGLETLIRAEPQVPGALSDCLTLLQEMNKKEHPSPTDFINLKDMVDALDTTITESVEKLDQTLKARQVPDNREVKKVLKDLKKAIDSTAEKEQELRSAQNEMTRLGQKLEGDQDLIKELRRSSALAESHAESFQKGTESLLEWSKAEQQKSSAQQTGSDEQREQMRVRWQSASSDLKISQQRVDELQVQRTNLLETTEELQSKLDEEKAAKQSLENDAKVDSKEHQDALTSLEKRLNEKIVEKEQNISDLGKLVQEAQDTTEDVREELKKLESEHTRATEDCQRYIKASEKVQKQNNNLQKEIRNATQKIEELKGVAQQLEESQQQSASAEAEIERLGKDRDRLNEFQKEASTLRQTLSSKEKEVASLKEQVQKGDETVKRMSQLQGRLDAAYQEQTRLQASLKSSREDASKMPVLQTQLEAMNSKATDLEAKLSAAHEKERQFEHTAKENASLSKSLQDTTAELNTARQTLEDQGKLNKSLREKDSTVSTMRQQYQDVEKQLEDQKKLAETLRQKDRTITELQKKTEEMEQVKAARDEMQKACEEKDSNIRQMNSELARHKAESQQLGELSNQLTERYPGALQALLQDIRLTQTSAGSQGRGGSQLIAGASQLIPHTRLELTKDVNFSQPSVQPQQKRGSTTENDMELEPEQPRRRVADRSGAMKPRNKLILRPPSATSQPQSTGSTNVVPNSQLETPDETLEFAQRGDSSSSLSDIDSEHLPSEDEGAELEDYSKGGATFESGPSRTRIEVHVPDQPTASPERPSTAQTDLFNVHTTGLSGVTARPSTRKKNSGPDSLFDTHAHQSHLETALPKTVAPRDLQLNAGDMLRRSHLDQISPRRLRDGTQLGGSTQLSGGRASTPMLEDRTNPTNVLNATPIQKTDKPMPNSAAKRSLEVEPGSREGSRNDKRLKRNHANVEISKPGPKPTPATPARSTASSGSRKGGSIIGTNAPADGGVKKPSKAPKKPSKKDKYVDKFNSQQET